MGVYLRLVFLQCAIAERRDHLDPLLSTGIRIDWSRANAMSPAIASSPESKTIAHVFWASKSTSSLVLIEAQPPEPRFLKQAKCQ
jgi:hypothetical protein